MEKSNTQKQSHDTENYPCSDLLSLGVLCPAPEQYLRISLTRVQSPLRTLQHPAPQLVFLYTKGTTPWNPPGLPSHEGNNTVEPTRSSFQRREQHKESEIILEQIVMIT
ncbi:hypothetical protein Taro_015159 [Colocasia esculenta]|uniref:Uncharacterized protein n=1 Tax=Colocasia esculenta TaxID=4460 RepID=A0A843UH18_COLES|nr:hypothetical protein [Colocasia esculenta]